MVTLVDYFRMVYKSRHVPLEFAFPSRRIVNLGTSGLLDYSGSQGLVGTRGWVA
jgi:hypothetical protein